MESLGEMITIRPAAAAEHETLAAIGLAAWMAGIAPHVPDAARRSMQADNRFRPFLESAGARVLVAEIAGRPVALGACEDGDDRISDVWVAPDCQGRGVGSALVRALEAEIAARGYREARIEALTANARAIGVYRRIGYRVTWRGVVRDRVFGLPVDKTRLARAL